ncbi:MAG: diacylglycerol kinase family protein [Candidatus Omnitrophota bacterium]|jgi:YegS/Rv2252/BmrU family lipid kinase
MSAIQEIPVILNKNAGRKSALALWLERLVIRPDVVAKEWAWTGQQIEQAVIEAFHDRGVRARLFVTQSPGHATQIAQILLRQGEPLIAVAGGDGTINEAVNALAGSKTAVGILPLGTANTFAIELGIPFSIPGAVEIIMQKKVRTIDLGKAGNHYFMMGAGMSFDSHVIRKIRSHEKRSLGSVAYILTGISESLRYSFPRLRVESHDGLGAIKSDGYLVIVSNARFYGGCFKAAPRALLDDGLLDVIVMKKRRVWDLLRYLSVMRKADITRLSDVDYFQCRKFCVTAESEVEIHVDAEVAEKTPCTFECIPGALKVIVPGHAV